MTIQNNKFAVVGLAGGVAETIASKLISIGVPTTCILDRSPTSPVLRSQTIETSQNVFIGDFEKYTAKSNVQSLSFSNLLDQRIVIITDDDGSTATADSDTVNSAVKGLAKITSVFPNTIKLLICASKVSNNDDKLPFFFRGTPLSASFNTWCVQNKISFISYQYGKLIGGIVGLEPIPFLSMPLIEPEVDPSYVLRSVVLSDLKSNQYAATELCTRETLSEAIIQTIQQNVVLKVGSNSVTDALVVSIVGKPPTEADWAQSFNRLYSSENTEILKISFLSINKPQQLINWISDFWFPQALIDADAATILSGPRPVRILNIPNEQKLKILWEDIQPDLSVKSVGNLEISLDNTSSNPCLIVKRLSVNPLPGDLQLIDKLKEGINKNVYKKQYCTPLEAMNSTIS